MEKSLGFLFPGQGSQFVGMGKDLVETYPQAKEIFETADSILGYSLSCICFEGPEDQLTRTRYAQPAIFVSSMAALSVLKFKYSQIKPKLTAGLSLGEFSALVAADSISFEDGLTLVQKRADAMEASAQAHPGAMASVIGLSESLCADIAAEAGCEVANINTPEQIVLSGNVESIEHACTIAEKKGAKRAIRLTVGGAFHSSLMLDAKGTLEKALEETSISTPKAIFIPNVLGSPISDVDEIRTLLARQLTSPVRWVETMQSTKKLGILECYEVGCSKILKGLARKTEPDLKVHPCGSVSDFERLEKIQNTQSV